MVTNDVNIHDNDNGYKEYMGQRADRWDNVLGDNATFSGTMQSDLNNDDDWKAWLKTMKKADVELTIIRDRVGKVTIFSTTKTSDGKVWTCHQEKGVDTEGDFVRVFLVCEESYLQFYYCNKVGEEDPKSTIGEIDTGEDHFPVSISVDGYPSAIEVGDKNFWKNAVATVVLDNGAQIKADSIDITFTVIPDLTTKGEKTIVLSYGKTKKGAFAQPVTTSYTIKVTSPIKSISAKYIGPKKTFYYFDNDIELPSDQFELTAIYSDNSSDKLGAKDATFTLSHTDGKVTATYNNYSCVVDAITTAKGTSAAGAPDKTSSWIATAFGAVATNTTKTVKVFVYALGTQDWQCALPEISGENGDPPELCSSQRFSRS